MNKQNSTGLMKFFGVLMFLFCLVYAVVGSLALAGTIENVLPGHETQEILVVVLAYAIALLGLICGILCMKGSAKGATATAVLVALFGLVGVIYNQITLDSFNLFDFITLLLGVSIIAAARQKKK